MQRTILVGVLVLGACAQPEDQARKQKLARVTVDTLVNHAYPQWVAEHPTERCPPRVVDLDEFTVGFDGVDPWGAPLRMLCEPGEPGIVRAIAIWSIGPDGVDGTADDISARSSL